MKKSYLLIIFATILLICSAVFYYFCTKSTNTDKQDATSNVAQESKAVKDNQEDEDDEDEEPVNMEGAVTKDLILSGYTSFNGKTSFSCNLDMVEDEDGGFQSSSIEIDANKFDLPKELYDYSSEILLRVTYSEEDLTVYDCQVVSFDTGEVVDDLSVENLQKLFDIEYDKEVKSADYAETVNLSTLEENEIYEFTLAGDENAPTFVNDTGADLIVYQKEDHEDGYEKEVYAAINIDSNSGASFSSSEGTSDRSLRVMYKKAEPDAILKLVDEDSMVKLSANTQGEELSYQFEDYIYNDTDEDATLEVEGTEEVVLPAGSLASFSWMTDSILWKE